MKVYKSDIQNFYWAVLLILSLLLSPIAAIPLVLYRAVEGRSKTAFFLLAIIFGVIGYYFRPLGLCDVTNYWIYIETYIGRPFSQALGLNYNNLFLVDIWFWILGNFGSKYLFSAICGFVTFGVILYLISDFCYKNSVNGWGQLFFIGLAFLTIDWSLVYSSGRNIVAIIIFLFALYRDLINSKRNIWTYICYLAPVFIHDTMIIYLGVRILVEFIKDIRNTHNILILCSILVAVLGISFLYTIFQGMSGNIFGEIIGNITEKAYSYFRDTESEYAIASSGSYYLAQRIIYIFLFLANILMFNMTVKGKVLEKKSYATNIYKFLITGHVFSYCGLITGIFVQGAVYSRFITIPILCLLFEMIVLISSNVKGIKIIIIGISILILAKEVHAFYLFMHMAEIQIELSDIIFPLINLVE